jgi:hypothetical protein
VLQDWSSAVTSGAALNDEDARLRRPRVGRHQRDSIENRHQRIDLGIIEKYLEDRFLRPGAHLSRGDQAQKSFEQIARGVLPKLKAEYEV